jgi:Mrp family chromosome partitioning ATPase
MATCFAQQGISVLLVETNLKHPRLATFTSIPSSTDLGAVVSGKSGPEYANLLAVPNLSLLSASDLMGHGLEQPGSSRMRELVQSWRERFDVVIIDGPAVLRGTGGLALCAMADHIVQVARHRHTTLTAVRRTVNLLSRYNNAPVSTVMTDVKERSPEFSGYYGYNPSRRLKKGMEYEEA